MRKMSNLDLTTEFARIPADTMVNLQLGKKDSHQEQYPMGKYYQVAWQLISELIQDNQRLRKEYENV